jgi:hypothetical protein
VVFGFEVASVLGVVATAVGIAGVVGFILAVVRVNVSKTTTDLYRQDNDALRARMKTMEEDGKIKDTKLTTAEAALVEKGKEVVMLRDMVSGTTAINRLADNMAGHFAITEALLKHAVGDDVFNAAKVERDAARNRERDLRGAPPESGMQ